MKGGVVTINIRKKTFEYYGFDNLEKEKLLEKCQNLNDEQTTLLLSCAQVACGRKELASQIAMSLTFGIGFYKLRNYMKIPLSKADDFYGYRRRTLWLFKLILKEMGQYTLPEISLNREGRSLCQKQNA